MDIDIYRADFDTPQTRMVERFYFYYTTENWGLHNRKLGFFRYNITKNMLVGEKEKQKRV